MTRDALYRLDPATGERRSFDMPDAGLPLGGAFASRQTIPANAVAHVGPHSVQIAPDGAVWTTLALGNHLARFDPKTERFELHPVPGGYYPHTLRFDRQGRIWFTLAVSNHVAMHDPRTGETRLVRLPARTWGQEAILRMMPAFLWLARNVDMDPERAGDGPQLPIPYGIDVAPDGGVWFSQLNERRIGRVDPGVPRGGREHAVPGAAPAASIPRATLVLSLRPALARFDPLTQKFRPGRFRSSPWAPRPLRTQRRPPYGHRGCADGVGLDHPLRARGATLHDLSDADPRHVHARDRLRRERRGVDVELEPTRVADRWRHAEDDPARAGKPRAWRSACASSRE
jgi:streptogramin lyase